VALGQLSLLPPNGKVTDGAGNIISEAGNGGATALTWTPYGKVKEVDWTSGPTKTTTYGYGADQQRWQKHTEEGQTTKDVYYARDAQGNVMAVYEKDATSFAWMEQHPRIVLWVIMRFSSGSFEEPPPLA
jgi:YD repeat-containing protein